MSVPESYSLLLNSQTSSNITSNTNLYAYSYNVNWAGILPTKYKKYSVNFQLKSANTSTVMFSGAQTTTVLTVNGVMFGQIYVGMQYINLTGISTVNSFGTGTGGNGTYNITGVSNATTTVLYSTNTTFTKNLLVSINFGKSETYDSSTTQSNQLGMIYPAAYFVSQNITSTNYNSTVLDNGSIEIYYPTNNNITVSITNLDGTPFTQMPHYCIQLYFNPITNDDDK